MEIFPPADNYFQPSYNLSPPGRKMFPVGKEMSLGRDLSLIGDRPLLKAR